VIRRHRASLSAAALAAALVAAATATPAAAQGPPLSLPRPSPAASVAQRVGLTDFDINYSRPAVRDREVWGGLVPWGQVWRAGANENTVLTASTRFRLEGHELPAGSYGLHMIPAEDGWTLIVSKISTNWGSFSYDAADDALRVPVLPEAAPFVEYLLYSFDDPSDRKVTAALRWAELRVPFRLEVDTPDLVVDSLKLQLFGLPQFFWQRWNDAARYALGQKTHLDLAKTWVERSISMNDNLTNRSTQAELLELEGKSAEAKAILDAALPRATEAELNQHGYTLMGQGQVAEAIAIFEDNVRRHPESWNVHDSLAEGQAAAGRKAEAIANYRKALAIAPEAQHERIRGELAKLGAGD
jgi:tetratricopeptide (TPR) repeat protein